MTSTPTTTMSSAAIRERFACRVAGEDLRPDAGGDPGEV
jgi:hypothetical protein